MVCNTYEKPFNELLILNRDILLHWKHLHFLVTEVYKPVDSLSSQFIALPSKGAN